MNIVFRVDSSVEIGSGHVMRCLTLAKKLVKQNHSVEFICRKMNGSMEGIIQAENFKVKLLDEVSESLWAWTTKNWAIDARQTIQEIAGEQVDLIIIDHYSIDEKWENELRNYTKKIMVIDDLANRKHSCDILLDQNYYLNMADRYKELISTETLALLGPEYVLIKDEFFSSRNSKTQKKILISFGGSDPTNETLKFLKLIKAEKLTYEIDVVIGNSNPYKSEIQSFINLEFNMNYLFNVQNMAELISEAEFIIGAAGVSALERIAMKKPSLVVAVAENQIEIAENLSKSNVIKYLGYYEDCSTEKMLDGLKGYITNKNGEFDLHTFNCKKFFKNREPLKQVVYLIEEKCK